MLQAKNYWDINQQIHSTITPSTRATADAPIRWPPAAVPHSRAPQRLSRHSWSSVNGLAVALGRLWALLQRHPCSRRHATSRARMELPQPHARPTVMTRRLACASRRSLSNISTLAIWIDTQAKSSRVSHWDARVLKIWNAATLLTLVATLMLRLMDLRPYENMVDDYITRGCSFEWCHRFSL